MYYLVLPAPRLFRFSRRLERQNLQWIVNHVNVKFKS